MINGRRYRVPEKIIVLDFWNKLNKRDDFQRYALSIYTIRNSCLTIKRDTDIPSGASSPLTSLSSLDDPEDRPRSQSPAPMADLDDFSVAKVRYGHPDFETSFLYVVSDALQLVDGEKGQGT